MAEVTFANAAEADPSDIDAFNNERFGDAAAERYMRGFVDVFAQLLAPALSGKPMPELDRHVRCITHRKHRVFYRSEGQSVFVPRIIQHAQRTPRLDP